MKKYHVKIVLGLLLSLTVVCVGASYFYSSEIYTPSNVIVVDNFGRDNIHISGKVGKGSLRYDVSRSDAYFILLDNNNKILVKYSDEFSNNFHEGANVILTGSLEKDNTFVAKSIGVLKWLLS